MLLFHVGQSDGNIHCHTRQASEYLILTCRIGRDVCETGECCEILIKYTKINDFDNPPLTN